MAAANTRRMDEDRLSLQAHADRRRARDADALEVQGGKAVAAASSLLAVSQHLTDTLRPGFLSNLCTLLLSRADVPGSRTAYRVSWIGPRSSHDALMTRRAARRIIAAADVIARLHKQRGGNGVIGLGITSVGSSSTEDGAIDCATAHAVAALIAEALPLARIGRLNRRYASGQMSLTLALFDAPPTDWRPLIDKQGEFARASMAEPIIRLLPELAHPPRRPTFDVLSRGGSQPLYRAVLPGNYEVIPGLFRTGTD